VIVVGDSPYDVQAAKKLQIRVIGLRSGGFADPVLKAAGADALYDDVEDLLRHYESSLFCREEALS
jgi:membrane protein